MSVVGIDLGTSNSAIALGVDNSTAITILPISQIGAPGSVCEKKLLPSALYLPLNEERASGAFALAWNSDCTEVIGEHARQRAETAPDRVILSAKSWLCNSAVDRHAPILPWRSELEIPKLSPVDVSQKILEHLRRALENAALGGSPQVVIAVPASFDEVARSLTVLAAERAGFQNVTLLEEPLAAFYAWLAAHEKDWRSQITPGDVVLVCDVGGGTADFSLIAVSEVNGALQLDRISVGNHILLGGDNMDIALAYSLRAQLEKNRKLDRWQLLALIQAARHGKEQLFSNPELESVPIAIAGKGARLIEAALSTPLSRELLERIILDGFFPTTSLQDPPHERKSSGLQDYGLPYAEDPAVTRHLAHFLRRSLETVKADTSLRQLIGQFESHEARGFLAPSKVLFNGGVFKASALRARVLDILSDWCAGKVGDLPGAELDLAVAHGAAHFGLIRQTGRGLRIRTKTLRSYYIGVEASMPAIPGYSPPLNALCVVPQGLEEGSTVDLPGTEFGLVTGETAEFRFFSSSLRASDAAGTLVEEAAQLEESARLETSLPARDKGREVVPVRLAANVSEVGALELWLQHTKSDQRWKLEFNVRGQ